MRAVMFSCGGSRWSVLFFVSTVMIVLTCTAPSRSQVPETISFQGVLKDDQGFPLADGSYELDFGLYEVGSPNAEWTETHTLALAGGIFEVELGSIHSLEDVDFSVPLELGISVESSAELTPRTPLTSSPYALSLRGLRVIPSSDPSYGAVNLVGGGSNNAVGGGVGGATIGGGGGLGYGFDARNQVDASHGTIAGGRDNRVTGFGGAILGGSNNKAGNLSTVGGGVSNRAIGSESFVGGGRSNLAATGTNGVVGGGYGNRAIGNSATVPGGNGNRAVGHGSFAAGYRARANHDGAFIWSDQSERTSGDSLLSTGDNQFLIRADGGVGINTNDPATQLHVVSTISGGASMSNHVAVIENLSDGSSPDVLALRVHAPDPDDASNFITFMDDLGNIGSVEGNGSGGVYFKTSGGDYAEMLPSRKPSESLRPGDVVGIRGGTIGHDTDGAQSIAVITRTAAVLGNAPESNEEGVYHPVAFIGQVDVRVRGSVDVGDYLIPSGFDDGTAVGVGPDELTIEQAYAVIGRVWSDCVDSSESHTVLAEVGLDRLSAAASLIGKQEEEIAILRKQVEELQRLIVGDLSLSR